MTLLSAEFDGQPDPGSSEARSGRVAAYLLSSLFIFLGLAALSAFAVTVLQDPAIRLILDWTAADGDAPPSLILAFLSTFGIVLPALVIGLGGAAIWLGFRLRSQHIGAGRWAQIALLWLTVASIALGILGLINLAQGAPGSPDAPLDLARALPVLLPLVSAGFFGGLLWWLNRSIDRIFFGQEPLNARETRLAWNLLIPTLTVFVLVAARPLEQTFIRSLTDKRFAGREVPSFVGLQNYGNLLGIRLDTVACRPNDGGDGCETRSDGSIRWESIERDLLQSGYRTVWTLPLPFGAQPQAVAISSVDADFLRGISTTLVFAAFSVTLELTIALFMAMTVNSSFAGRGLMRAVMLVPWAIPTVISARLWELMLKDTSAGIVNRILMDLRLIDSPQAWLSDVTLQLPAAIMVDVWKTAPFMALLLLAGLQTIPKDLYEAASVDGASRARQFVSITLPLLRPTIAVALIFRTLDALRVFDLFNVLFGRQQLTMATYNYEMLVNNQRDGYASAISMIIFALISVFAIVYVRMLNVENE
jgi:trehalose/maltose transport system permease protein